MAKVKIQGHASGTGIFTVTAPNSNTDRTITLPDGTGTLAFTTGDDDKLPLAGGTMTGDLNFGDDVDINLGTGSDLKIYHDGSNSRIHSEGTGNLLIQSDNSVEIQQFDNNEEIAKFISDGAVELYYNGSKKFATTDDGVNVGTDTVKVFQGYESIQLADRCMIGGYANDSLGLFYNTYHSSGSKAIDTAAAANIQLINTGIRFQTAASVSADAAQTMVDRLMITTAGLGQSQFTARAWCNYNDTTINDSHNVSSVTDQATGEYRVNWDVDLANATYALALSCQDTWYNENSHTSQRTQNVGYSEFYHFEGSSIAKKDGQREHGVVFGD